jgi:hypothetical protein
MIGRQLRLYLHPADHAAVERYVHEDLASALVAERSDTPMAMEVDSNPDARPGALVCPRSLLTLLQPRHITTQGYYVLHASRDQVIEWWYSKLTADGLHPGRFYYVPSDPMDGSAPRDERFLQVAERLFQWARKTATFVATEWGRERLGPEAASRYLNGELQLRRNPPGSRI